MAVDRTRAWLDQSLLPAYADRCQSAGRPLGETLEESPGSMETRWRLTAAGGDPRDSATENEPPSPRSPSGLRMGVRVKRCGKSAPRDRQRNRHGKPHREQDRIGTARGPQGPQAWLQAAVRVGCIRCRASAAADEWPSRRGNPAIQNPAYRPTGSWLCNTIRTFKDSDWHFLPRQCTRRPLCKDCNCHPRRSRVGKGKPSLTE